MNIPHADQYRSSQGRRQGFASSRNRRPGRGHGAQGDGAKGWLWLGGAALVLWLIL